MINVKDYDNLMEYVTSKLSFNDNEFKSKVNIDIQTRTVKKVKFISDKLGIEKDFVEDDCTVENIRNWADSL